MKQEIQATTVKKNGRLTAIASTEDPDRGGDVLLVKNWDFEKFLQNPVLQAGHKYDPQYTIGKAENLRVEGNQVLFDPIFHEITPLAKQIKKMYEDGFLKAWSVGFIPGTAQLNGKSVEEGGTKNELLEVSAVAVPANAYALMKGFEMDNNELEKEIKEFVNSQKSETVEVAETEEVSVEEVAEEKAVQQFKTGETNEHVHMANFDEETGNGSTDEVNGHVHSISNFEVQEANDHTHALDLSALTDSSGNMYGKKKPKKKKSLEPVERWNKQLPESFNKEFDIYSIDNVRMSFQNEIFTKFFDCEVKHLFVNNYFIPSPLIGTYLSGFKEVSKDFELVDTRNWHSDFEYPPLYEVIQLNSTKSAEFLVEGIQFLKVAGKNTLVLKHDVGWDGMYVSIITNNDKRDWNKELLEKVHHWAKENNFLRGEKFALSGEFIKSSKKGWDDVILDSKVKDVVRRTVAKVKEEGSTSRGILMMGPPGTGKTLTGKIMLNESESTFIWVSAKDMYRIGAVGALKFAFKMARELGPAILFMEDIDEWIKGGATDLLKTEMDGIQENKGLITVLTSNHPEALPDALLDRPGRFHEILKFGLPDASVRKEMIIAWTGTELSEEKIKELVDRTEGYSGAYMKELVDFARVIAEDEQLSLQDALVRSLDKLQEQRELVQGIRQEHKSLDMILSLKEGRIISKANRKKLETARDAIDEVLAIEKRENEKEDEIVEGMKNFVPNKNVTETVTKTKVKRVLSSDEVTRLTLQKIAGLANSGLHESKKSI